MQLKSVSIEKTTGTRSHYRMWKPESFPLLFPCRVTSTLIHLHGLYIEPIKTQYVSHAITVTINVGHSFLCFRPSLGEYLAYLEHCVCPARKGSVNHYHIGQYCNSRWIVAYVARSPSESLWLFIQECAKAQIPKSVLSSPEHTGLHAIPTV